MDNDTSLRDSAEQALAWMKGAGFDHAQASVSQTAMTELNITLNEPSLMRSTELCKLSLVGLVDGRRAATELGSLDEIPVREAIAQLFEAACSAPQDAANAVSSGQQAQIERGPLQADSGLLADKVAELLQFRAQETPRMMIEEGTASHQRQDTRLLTSGGSLLSCRRGWYEMTVFGSAHEGARTSSFNVAAGTSAELASRPAPDWFGIGDMLRDTSQQVDTRPLDRKFVGDVVLTPQAVEDLLGWLLGQLSDTALISGSSLYRERVGQIVAAPSLGLRSRFDVPGVAPFTADGFAPGSVEVLRDGRLLTPLPSLYGSRRTGLPHVPVAEGGWEIAAGERSRSELVAGVARGAVVGRLSMGMPAANGDFSGVIKNSFLVENGVVGTALSEVMISGNIARMLQDLTAVSRERIDTGATLLPWLQIGGLHFS